jgi:hypothetical protein
MHKVLSSLFVLSAVALACGGGNVARFAPCNMSTDTCPSATTCEAVVSNSSSSSSMTIGATFCTWTCSPSVFDGQSCPNDPNGVQGICVTSIDSVTTGNSSFGFCFQDCSSSGICPDGETCQKAQAYNSEDESTSAMVCVPTPNDPLSGTTWQSTTITTQPTMKGVTALTYTMTFGMTNGTAGGFASGPFSATLAQTYGASAVQYSGCTETTTFSGGVWADSPPTQGMAGAFTVSNAMGSTDRTGCSANGDDVTGEMGDYDGAVNNDQNASSYTVTGMTMTVRGGDGVTPYTDNANWTFTKM